MIVNSELERMRKEAIMACFKVLSQHLPGGKTMRNLIRIASI
jgi:hypothetical protein